VSACRAASQYGGGIYNYNGGTLKLTNSPVTSNAAEVRPLPARRAPAGLVRTRRRQEE
jgi:hypothetical protein